MKNLQKYVKKVVLAESEEYGGDDFDIEDWYERFQDELNFRMSEYSEKKLVTSVIDAMLGKKIELDKDFIEDALKNFKNFNGDEEEEIELAKSIVRAILQNNIELDNNANNFITYFLKEFHNFNDDIEGEYLRENMLLVTLENYDDKKEILNLIPSAIEKIGDIGDIEDISDFASSMNEKALKMMLQNKEVLKEIDNKMEDSYKILSYFIAQLGKYKELCNDKEFMMQLLDNLLEEFDIGETPSSYELSEILKSNCEELWKDKEFNQKLIKLVKNHCDEDLIGLTEYMLPTEELANDKELAFEYCKAFPWSFGKINEDLVKDKEFLTQIFDQFSKDVFDFIYGTNDKELKMILQDKELMKKFCNIGEEYTNLDIDEVLSCFIYQLSDYKELCNDKEFMMQLLDNLEEFDIKDTQSSYELTEILESNCEELWKDKEFNERMIEFVKNHCDEELIKLLEYMLPTEDLLKDKDFLIEILDNCKNIGGSFILPKEFSKDEEIVKRYLETEGRFVGISFELLRKYGAIQVNEEDNVYELVEMMEKNYNEDIPEKYESDDMRYGLALKIKETGTIVTHFGDDLDNKSAIEAIQRWAEDNDLIKIGQKLNIIRVPAGQIKEGYLNVDTGGHEGSRLEEDGTIIIDGDLNYGIKSASQELSKLGIYVPEQIVELADTKTNKVSALDSRSGLALVRYLTGDQTFKLAETGLLDKSLTDEQLEEYGLTDAHKKQQEIIDNAVEKIEEYTEILPNGEKIVIAKEQILGGSAIAYEKGINYYVSVSEHLDENKNSDGVTFAITSKPGIELPDDILDYGKELVEEYRIDEKSSGVFVSPNNQMIVAGGFKNPQFKIPGKTIDEIAEEIKDKFLVQEKEDAFVNTIVSNAKEKKELEQKNGQAQTLLSEFKKLNNKKTK